MSPAADDARRVHGREPDAVSETTRLPAIRAREVWARISARNWRLVLVRVVVSGVAVVLTVLLVPGLDFTGWTAGRFWLVAIVYAMLTALVKPLLEFLTLRFLVATYGLVVILVNAALLYLLVTIVRDALTFDRLWQLVVGGLLVGLIGLVLETVVGATQPVLDREIHGAQTPGALPPAPSTGDGTGQ